MFANDIRASVRKSVDQLVTAINKRVVTFSSNTDTDSTKRDANRGGKWSSSWDFQAACLSHGFGMKHFTLLPRFIFMHWGLGVFFLVTYTLDLLIFTLPIVFVQSFLGQFSSSGYISAFRAAPIAKGLGYVILVFNVISSSYGSVNAAVPLVFILSSLTNNLPWTNCNNGWNTVDCKDDPPKFSSSANIFGRTWSSTEFFNKAIALTESEGWQISWRILACTIVVWLGIGAIISKGLQTIAKLFRYSTFIMVAILITFFIRIMCLPGTVNTIIQFFVPDHHQVNIIEFFTAWVYSSAPAALTFGPGWGNILAMSSFNSFNKDIKLLSLIICFGHMAIVFVTGISVFMVQQYLEKYHDFTVIRVGGAGSGINQLDYIYTAFPYLFGKLEFSQLWSVMFFTMVFLSEFSACVMQVFAVLTALFDEHEIARYRRHRVTIGLLSALLLASIFFASNRGFVMFSVRYSIEGIIQMLICLMELMVVAWIFGRIRFRRDVKFMIGFDFKSWMFFLMRFITPLCILLVLILYIILACIDVFENKEVVNPASLIIIKLIPFFIFIPGYVLIKLIPMSEERSTKVVIDELYQPKDWYPLDDDDYRRYADEFGALSVEARVRYQQDDEEIPSKFNGNCDTGGSNADVDGIGHGDIEFDI